MGTLRNDLSFNEPLSAVVARADLERVAAVLPVTPELHIAPNSGFRSVVRMLRSAHTDLVFVGKEQALQTSIWARSSPSTSMRPSALSCESIKIARCPAGVCASRPRCTSNRVGSRRRGHDALVCALNARIVRHHGQGQHELERLAARPDRAAG
jgi:hypothetical protein